MANSKVKTHKINIEDGAEKVEVRVIDAEKITTIVGRLIELDDKTFKKVARIANTYIKANELATRLFGDHKIDIVFSQADNIVRNASHLIALGRTGYKKAIKCAKQYRKANKMMDKANHNYDNLEEQVGTLKMEYAYEG